MRKPDSGIAVGEHWARNRDYLGLYPGHGGLLL